MCIEINSSDETIHLLSRDHTKTSLTNKHGYGFTNKNLFSPRTANLYIFRRFGGKS